jgi:hypothetical protein
MTQQDLIDLGFTKEEMTDDDDFDYYYVYEITENTTLISDSASLSGDNNWSVELFDDDKLCFKEVNELKLFINLIKMNRKV